MNLSIIIVNWNTVDLLEQCLASIDTHPPASDTNYEIIVIDNFSSDNSVPMIKEKFPNVVLLENKDNVGFAKANNQGIAMCRGEYVLLLNSDTKLLPGSLDALVSCADSDEKIGMVGGKLLNADFSFQASGNNFPTLFSETMLLMGIAKYVYNPYFPSFSPKQSEMTQLCDWLGGAYLLVRKSAIDQLGGLDESFFMYSEEVEWCYRMVQGGWKNMYCAEAPVIHFGGGSTNRVSLKYLKNLYGSKIKFLKMSKNGVIAGLFAMMVRLASTAQGVRWYINRILKTDEQALKKSQIYFQLSSTRL